MGDKIVLYLDRIEDFRSLIEKYDIDEIFFFYGKLSEIHNQIVFFFPYDNKVYGYREIIDMLNQKIISMKDNELSDFINDKIEKIKENILNFFWNKCSECREKYGVNECFDECRDIDFFEINGFEVI